MERVSLYCRECVRTVCGISVREKWDILRGNASFDFSCCWAQEPCWFLNYSSFRCVLEFNGSSEDSNMLI